MSQNKLAYKLMHFNMVKTRMLIGAPSSVRYFSTSTPDVVDYIKELDQRSYSSAEDLRKELKDFIQKIDAEENRIEDVQAVTTYMSAIIDKMKMMRSPPISEYTLALNHAIEKTGTLDAFEEHWKILERLCYSGISFLSNESTVNIVYYFCKFRKTSKTFWSRFDSKLSLDIKNLEDW